MIERSDISKRIEKRMREWKQVEVGNGHMVWMRPIDPEIIKQMPATSRTFLQVGPIELVLHQIKKALHPYDEIPY